MAGYRMTLRDGTRYDLDGDGYVTARSDGPRGWDYRHGWRIVGFTRRYHSRVVVPLPIAADRLANGARVADVVGWGLVIDWDHGTYRQWASPQGHRLRSLVRA